MSRGYDVVPPLASKTDLSPHAPLPGLVILLPARAPLPGLVILLPTER